MKYHFYEALQNSKRGWEGIKKKEKERN